MKRGGTDEWQKQRHQERNLNSQLAKRIAGWERSAASACAQKQLRERKDEDAAEHEGKDASAL